MASHLERYHAILAGRGMKVGDQVVCTTRCPTPHQWWIHPWWVGVIEEVSDDAASWNGHNSEAYYCANFLYVKVRYLGSGSTTGFTQRDELASLLPLHGDPVTESPMFGGTDAEAIPLYQFACRVGLGERYAEASQKAWRKLNQEWQGTAYEATHATQHFYPVWFSDGRKRTPAVVVDTLEYPLRATPTARYAALFSNGTARGMSRLIIGGCHATREEAMNEGETK